LLTVQFVVNVVVPVVDFSVERLVFRNLITLPVQDVVQDVVREVNQEVETKLGKPSIIPS